MSEIERGLRQPTAEQALRIEEVSGGRIDASALHPLIAAARAAGPCAVEICDLCDRRADHPTVNDCTAVNCGLRQREAA